MTCPAGDFTAARIATKPSHTRPHPAPGLPAAWAAQWSIKPHTMPVLAMTAPELIPSPPQNHRWHSRYFTTLYPTII